MNSCKHESCKNQVNIPHDKEYCIFHAPNEKKGISVGEYNKLILAKIEQDDLSFASYIFPGDIDFCKAKFAGDVSFREAQFSGEADFVDVTFSREADFSDVTFSGKTYFCGAQFLGEVYFVITEFSDEADFQESRFSAYTNFDEARFLASAVFIDAKFLADVVFSSGQFVGCTNFYGAQFSGRTSFTSMKISGELIFTDNTFGSNCRFTLGTPIFDLPQDGPCLLIFERAQFIPYLTYFENIDPTKALSNVENTSIGFLFRYCQLKDVYFSKCDLSNFSFYKSSFEEARFISSKWGKKRDSILKIPYWRENIIYEELLLDELKKDNQDNPEELKSTFIIEDIANYSDIGKLYQRMKTALDRTKDFYEGGWFYFNEVEMKRYALRENLKHMKLLKRLKNRITILLKYNLYLIFAGYGEKPLWSFFWVIIFTFLFAPLHLLSGLEVGETKTINYMLTRDLAGIQNVFTLQFTGDFLTALIYSLYRIIPNSYLPKTSASMTPIGLDGLLLSLVNTLVMILLLSFIIIGLKRRFRRF